MPQMHTKRNCKPVSLPKLPLVAWTLSFFLRAKGTLLLFNAYIPLQRAKQVSELQEGCLGWIYGTAVPPRGRSPSQGGFSRATTSRRSPGMLYNAGGEQPGLHGALLGIRAPRPRAPPALPVPAPRLHRDKCIIVRTLPCSFS